MEHNVSRQNNPFLQKSSAEKYDWFVQKWPFLRRLRREESQAIHLLFDNYLASDNRVLEIGAGTGYYTLGIASKVKSLTALEPSGEMISALQNKTEKLGIDNVRIVKNNLFDYRAEEMYDWAIAIGVLDYIEDWEHFLDKSLNLSPNLILTFPQRGLWSLIYMLLSRFNGTKIYRYTKRQLSDYFKNCVLEVVETGFKTRFTAGHTLVIVVRKKII